MKLDGIYKDDDKWDFAGDGYLWPPCFTDEELERADEVRDWFVEDGELDEIKLDLQVLELVESGHVFRKKIFVRP